MNARKRRMVFGALALGIALAGSVVEVRGEPVGTAFTYQGRLTDGGFPATGVYDLEFALYDQALDGSLANGPVYIDDLAVVNGLFTVQLDFGAGVFDGEARWLEICVRPAGSGNGHVCLEPLQELTPTPYAMYASDADEAVCLGAADGDPADVVCVDNDGDVSIGESEQRADVHIIGDTRMNGALSLDTGEPGREVLDQSQKTESYFSLVGSVWQSFTVGLDGRLTRIEVKSKPGSDFGTVGLCIYPGEGMSSDPLWCGNPDRIGIVGADGLVAFEIIREWIPELEAGAVYTFGIVGEAEFWIASEDDNPYPYGRSSRGNDIDLWFCTYVTVGYFQGDIVTVTEDGNVGIGTADPWSKLTVEEGHLSIRKRLRGLPHHEWVDIDVTDSSVGALYSVTVHDGQNSPNFRLYLVLFAAANCYATCNVVAATSSGWPSATTAEFQAVADPGCNGPYRLQIRSDINHPIAVNVSKIQTYP